MEKFKVVVLDYDGNESISELVEVYDNMEDAQKYATTIERYEIPALKDEGILAYVEIYKTDENDECVGEPLYSTKENYTEEEIEKVKVGDREEELVEANKKEGDITKMSVEALEEKLIECNDIISKGKVDIKVIEQAEIIAKELEGRKVRAEDRKGVEVEVDDPKGDDQWKQGFVGVIVNSKPDSDGTPLWVIEDQEGNVWDIPKNKVKSLKASKKVSVKVEAREKTFLPEGTTVICDNCKLEWSGKGWKWQGATENAKFLYDNQEVAFDYEGTPYVMGEVNGLKEPVVENKIEQPAEIPVATEEENPATIVNETIEQEEPVVEQ